MSIDRNLRTCSELGLDVIKSHFTECIEWRLAWSLNWSRVSIGNATNGSADLGGIFCFRKALAYQFQISHEILRPASWWLPPMSTLQADKNTDFIPTPYLGCWHGNVSLLASEHIHHQVPGSEICWSVKYQQHLESWWKPTFSQNWAHGRTKSYLGETMMWKSNTEWLGDARRPGYLVYG